MISELLIALKENAPNTLLVYGKGGIGKTNLLMATSSILSDTVYYNFDTFGNYGEYLKQLIFKIDSELINIGLSATDLLDEEKALQLIKERTKGIIIFIDTTENTDYISFEKVIKKLSQNEIQVCIALREAGKINFNYIPFECPSFTEDESKELMSKAGITDLSIIKRLHLQSEGNPLTLRRELMASNDFHLSSMEKEKLKVIAQKLEVTGSFIDAGIFCKYLKIDFNDIKRLKEQGLIYNIDKISFPHDRFLEEFGFKSNQDFNEKWFEDSLNYWQHESRLRKRFNYPKKQIIDLLLRYRIPIPQFDNLFSNCIEKLWQANEIIPIDIISDFFIETSSTFYSTLTTLAYIHSEIGEFQKVDNIYQKIYSTKTANFDSSFNRLKLAFARSCWWKGDYENCISISENVIKQSSSNFDISKAKLEIGIGYFFLGDWEKSKSLLKESENMIDCDPRTYGWCKLIHGTIDCIRGVDFEGGEQRLEDSIVILREEGDLTGLAIAYGNLGECLWKKGDFEKAKTCLESGYVYAVKSNMPINAIESKRNQLQLEIRWHGPFTEEAEILIRDLSDLTTEGIGEMEMMQVSNTLSTAYFYRNDLEQAKKLLTIANKLTKDNSEYYIYTLGNYCLQYILENNHDKANKYALKFISLANHGENIFAKQQILDDIYYLQNRYGLKLAGEIIQLTKKTP